MNSTKISVVVPHLNQPDGLEACLSSLDHQTLNSSLFEIIVVDNGSDSIPDAVVKRHPRARLLSELTPGPGPARNAGVLDSVGHIIAFVDADCRAHPDWLNVALERISAAPNGTVLGGDVRIWHEGKHGQTAVEAYESVFAYRFKLYIERRAFSGTGNLVMRREDFDKVGPFGGIQIAEDIDWGHRARDAGLSFQYVPQMIVFHPPRNSVDELFIKWNRHLQHELNVTRGKPAWRLRWVARALAILISPVVDAFMVFTSDRVHGIRLRLKALMVLFVIRMYRAWMMVRLLFLHKGIVWNRSGEVRLPDVK